MAQSDHARLSFVVGAAAEATIATQAAERVYRAQGPMESSAAEVALSLRLHEAACLRWLPQETILFDRVRLRRTIDVTLTSGASLIVAEAVVFGRAAMGETVGDGCLFDRWRVRVDGRLIFAETLRLDGAVAQRLEQRAVAAGGIAIATVLKFPGDETGVAAVRAIGETCAGEVGVSAWNGLALARLVAKDGAALRRDLASVVTALGERHLPRLWLN
jgi:urease accessory protein